MISRNNNTNILKYPINLFIYQLKITIKYKINIVGKSSYIVGSKNILILLKLMVKFLKKYKIMMVRRRNLTFHTCSLN